MAESIFASNQRLVWSRLLGLLVLTYVMVLRPPALFPAWAVGLGQLLGFVLLGAAAFGRIWCSVYVAGRKNDVLVTEGPYSVVRNPLYAFSFLGAVGFGLMVENPILALLLAIGFLLYYRAVVREEEALLAGAFGEVYAAYRERTPRWIPDFGLYSEPDSLRIDPGRVRRGILEAMWFVWLVILWEVWEQLRASWM